MAVAELMDRQMRHDNPSLSTFLLAGLVISGLVVLSKIGAGGLSIGDWLKGTRPRTSGRAELYQVKHDPLPNGLFGAQPFPIEWVVQHKGPAEHYKVGVAIASGVNWLETFEADLWVNDDADWTTYTVSMTAQITKLYIGNWLVGYINDDNGARKDQKNV